MAFIRSFLVLFLLACFTRDSTSQSDFQQEDVEFAKQSEDQTLGLKTDELFGIESETDLNSVHYVNDGHEGSGEDDFFIPVPEKPKLPKSRPKLEDTENVTDANMETTVEHTSFTPVEFNIEHKYALSTTEDQSTTNPERSDPKPEESTPESEPLPEQENELEPHKELIESMEKEEETAPSDADEKADGGEFKVSDNGHDNNETNVVFGENTKRTHSDGLSNIAKIGIAMGCIVVFWLLICPVVCIICRRRDRKREKRAEEYKLKNGVPHQQHPLVEELVITELGQNDNKNQSNGKQKLYGTEAQSAEELQCLSSQANGSNISNNSEPVVKKPFPGNAPLASEEALDTEV